MKKMPCLFERTFHDKGRFTLHPTVTPGCEWVLSGEGIATRKRDGTACMVREGRLYKRYDAKRNHKTSEYRIPPEGSIPCDEPDSVTGHWPHWVPVGDEPESVWHREAWNNNKNSWNGPYGEGTYELCGPRLQGNPEGLEKHIFFKHGIEVIPYLSPVSGLHIPRTFEMIQEFLTKNNIEGIVFWRLYDESDDRMCKIRRADFGLPWGKK